MAGPFRLFCCLGLHDDDLAYAPMRMRCTRCGREVTVLADLGPPLTPLFTGHLTTAEVRRITRRGKRRPAYISPQVEAELACAQVSRAKRGPAVILAMREGGKR